MGKQIAVSAPAAEAITLYFKEGSSDKVYSVSLEKSGPGWVVKFAFGRRGSTLNTGTKTQSPIEFSKAKKIYDKLIAEKTAKGYTPGEDGTPYTSTSAEERDSGIRCMLLNELEESELERLISDDAWGMQEKMDGRRQLILAGTGASGINRKGLVVALAEPIARNAEALVADHVIDGEAIGDVFYAFDILQDAGADVRAEGYFKRYVRLAKALSGKEGAIKLVPLAEGACQKRELFHQLKARGAEGVVFKKLNAPYTAGRPDSGGNALKFKFYTTGSFIVAKVNQKRSVALQLVDGTQVGNVTIPPNKDIPLAGEVVEVRYLYAFPGGSLFQPVFLGNRDDISVKECTAAQLKFKAGEEDEV